MTPPKRTCGRCGRAEASAGGMRFNFLYLWLCLPCNWILNHPHQERE